MNKKSVPTFEELFEPLKTTIEVGGLTAPTPKKLDVKKLLKSAKAAAEVIEKENVDSYNRALHPRT